jgi:hypothetical protein
MDELKRKIVVKYPAAKILHIGPLLWAGWECDPAFAVIELDGKRMAVSTHHGSITEIDTDFLYERRKAAGDAIRGYLEGIRLVTE